MSDDATTIPQEMPSDTTSTTAVEERQPSITLVGAFLDLVYGLLVTPINTFRRIADQQSIKNPPEKAPPYGLFGLFTLTIVSAVRPLERLLTTFKEPTDGMLNGLLSAMGWIPFEVVFSLFFWLLLAAIIALLAFAFGCKARYKTLVTLLSLASLPWLFFLPFAFMKATLGLSAGPVMGTLFLFLGGVAGLMVWAWSGVLYTTALAVTYHLSLERVLVLLMAPVFVVMMSLAWVCNFFADFGRLF